MFILQINEKEFTRAAILSFPILTVKLMTPRINLPVYKKNELGEWQRDLGLSFPTLINWDNIAGISWQIDFRIFGFGIAISFQYGY